MQTFYLVWNSNTGYTNKRYECESEHLATEEAERLAAKSPGCEVFVLQAVSMSKTEKPVKTIELNDLPF